MDVIEFNVNGLKGELKVFQSPAAINVTEGGSMQLNCTFEANQTVGRVVWRRASENMEMSDSNPFYQRRIVKSGPTLFAQKMIFIKIHNLTKMDSDFYYCEVEIQGIGVETGKGTQLIVIDKKATDCPPLGVSIKDGIFPIMLRIFLGLFTVVIILLLSRLYHQRKAIRRLKGSHTVALSISDDHQYDQVQIQATPSPTQETILPNNCNASFLEYSTIMWAADKGSIPSNQHLTYVQSTFQ
ncbi:natural cytotoxicity triggering receptor 3-like isoform X2 [Heterodontus francisci]|uniref:natural cytotoxicity triggering receptor 3-like isoform X2 n=1 Tax=Heterodontus francisci TaxID=7792 RepID=UPI00355C9681